MKSPPPWDVYSIELSSLQSGKALWEPDPGLQYDQVDVGDVGFIRSGFFLRLFNVLRQPDHPLSHGPWGLPDGFEPLEFPVTIHSGTPHAAGTMHSKSIESSAVSAGLQVNSGGVGPVAELSFRRSNDRAAALVLSYPAYRFDVLETTVFKTYMLKHYKSWRDFCKPLFDIKPVDIILVTGCDRTCRWAMMAFSRGEADATLQAGIEVPNMISAKFSFSRGWQASPSVQHRWGPQLCTPPTESHVSPVPLQDVPPIYNQTVFIRGYHVLERSLWPTAIKASAGPHNLPPGGRDNPDETVLYTGVKDDMDSDADVWIKNIPDVDGDTILAKPILEYILTESDADIAIAHDEELFPYSESSEREDIVTLLKNERIRVSVTDGVGSLQVEAPDPSRRNFKQHISITDASSHFSLRDSLRPESEGSNAVSSLNSTCRHKIAEVLAGIELECQSNSKECLKVSQHTAAILRVFEVYASSCRLPKLEWSAMELARMLRILKEGPMFQKILWKDAITNQIATVYQDMSDIVNTFRLGLDMHIFMQENEEARKIDAECNQNYLKQVLDTDTDEQILEGLEIDEHQTQDAVTSINQRLLDNDLPSFERKFFRRITLALQSRADEGETNIDGSTISSLDVIVFEEAKLGEGLFAEVYEAHWKGMLVAVKVLRTARGLLKSAFQEQAAFLMQLRHENTLQYFGACHTQDLPFIVCALKEGGDALTYLREHPNANRTKLLLDACQGLAYLHENDVVHAYLKATNILVDANGRACLANFGLAYEGLYDEETSDLPKHSIAQWTSPELLFGGIVNNEADIYGFGITIYETFMGKTPFEDMPDDSVYRAVQDCQCHFSRPTDVDVISRLGLDDDMWALIDDCVAWEPYQRPQAAEIVIRLNELAHTRQTDTAKDASNGPAGLSRSHPQSHLAFGNTPANVSPSTTASPEPLEHVIEDRLQRAIDALRELDHDHTSFTRLTSSVMAASKVSTRDMLSSGDTIQREINGLRDIKRRYLAQDGLPAATLDPDLSVSRSAKRIPSSGAQRIPSILGKQYISSPADGVEGEDIDASHVDRSSCHDARVQEEFIATRDDFDVQSTSGTEPQASGGQGDAWESSKPELYVRYNQQTELAIYTGSWIKLANVSRSLREKVLISNQMSRYLELIGEKKKGKRVSEQKGGLKTAKSRADSSDPTLTEQEANDLKRQEDTLASRISLKQQQEYQRELEARRELTGDLR